MKLGFASDHRGYELKRRLIEFFNSEDLECFDVGAFNETKSDYPVYSIKLAKKVVGQIYDFGIAICGSGIGVSIASNKVKGARAAKVSTVSEARLAREDNNANIVTFSSETEFNLAKDIILTFVNTDFNNEERHLKRIEQIRNYEEGQSEF